MPTEWTTQKKWINSQKGTIPKLDQKETENINRQITGTEIETNLKT